MSAVAIGPVVEPDYQPLKLSELTDCETVVCLMSRMTAGLGVQLLWCPITEQVAITLALNGELETFSVPTDSALEAFHHPYAYGATLPL